MSTILRDATDADAATLANIYNHYVTNTHVTFEADPLAPAEMTRRVADVQGGPLPWLVAETAEGIAGYAYASSWKGRCAYRFSVETTVYLDPASIGQGLGRTLYGALLDALRTRRMHTAIGGIALPNAASVALHERLGFRKVARFEQVGYKFDRWIDVGYWQLLL